MARAESLEDPPKYVDARRPVRSPFSFDTKASE